MSSSSASSFSPPPADLLLNAIVDSSDDAILSKNLDGIVTSWNRSAERLYGYAAEEIVGLPAATLIPPDRQEEEREILRRIQAGERIDHFHTLRLRKDGRLIEVSVTISPIRNHVGQVIGASNIARDITDQEIVSRRLYHMAAIVASSDDAIVSKNLDGIIQSWNEGAQRIFGYTPEEAIGKSVLMLLPPDRQHEEPKILERLRKGERIEHFDTIRVRKNGEHFPVSLTVSPVRDATGKVIGASKIARDVTELRRLGQEREHLLESERMARARAEHESRMKDEFLAVVSHELRTPLNAIVGWTEVLKDPKGTREDLAAGLDTIERNALMQAQLIEDLLDLGRITSGKMALTVEQVNLNQVVEEAIGSVRHAADQKAIRIKTVLHDMRATLMGDRKRLQQVIWNILSNAIKFTPSGGSILITLGRVASRMEIAVSDTGRGITADFLPFVFERFRQADMGTTRRQGGLGIGLSLVKQLVELHGGDVRVESAGEGKGATFTVSLPVAATGVARRRNDPLTGVPVHAKVEEILTGIRVLAIDDDKDSLEVLRRILTSREAQVVTATSAKEALHALSTYKPDVILSDIGMPDEDGFTLIRRIRSLPDRAAVPAAALTALARSEDRMRALQAGFQTHVTKPVAPAELVAVVKSLAALHGPKT